MLGVGFNSELPFLSYNGCLQLSFFILLLKALILLLVLLGEKDQYAFKFISQSISLCTDVQYLELESIWSWTRHSC